MKVRNLFAASLAAMSLFSCSNEVDELNSGASLAPGDALISIDLGGGKTTYSTEELEDKILNGSAKLFKKDGGGEIKLTDPRVDGAAKKFTATISADDFTPGDVAELYLYINATPADQTTADDFKNVLANTELNYNLSKGIPASGIKELTLQAGAIQAPSSNVTRVASRLGAIVPDGYSLSDLKDYKVEISNYLTNGYLFAGGSGTTLTPVSTPLTTILGGSAPNMYNGAETINYLYPATDVVVTVSAPAPSTEKRTATFSPAAGKNYTLKITPMKKEDASFDWNISIDSWGTDVNGGEVDFSKPETGGGTDPTPDPDPEEPKTDLEKLLVDFGGQKWMPFNTSGNLVTDEATAKEILATEGDDYLTKIVNFAKKDKVSFEKIAGKAFNHQGIQCPSGYRVAKLADYAALTGGDVVPVRPGSDPKWNESTIFTDKSVRLMKMSQNFSYPTGVNTNFDFYWLFVKNEVGAEGPVYLPFIGAHTNTQITQNSSVITNATGSGMGIWTQQNRSGVDQRERVSPWNDGWANNASAYTSSFRAYVRCIKAAATE